MQRAWENRVFYALLFPRIDFQANEAIQTSYHFNVMHLREIFYLNYIISIKIDLSRHIELVEK